MAAPQLRDRTREDSLKTQPSDASTHLDSSDLKSAKLTSHNYSYGRSCTIQGIETTLLTNEEEWKVRGWFPRDLEGHKLVVFPDACPGKAPLPTGTALLTSSPSWRSLAISDCGCGMQLLKSELTVEEFTAQRGRWDDVGQRLKKNRGKLGDLGGGNHFLDALQCYSSDRVYFLIHTGSRLEEGLVEHLIKQPKEFDTEFSRIVGWARGNRDTIADGIKAIFGRTVESIWDQPHNTVEKLGNETVLIRKGVVAVKPGETVVIPSSMTGDVSMVTATAAVSSVLDSVSHGTGRVLSRSDAKNLHLDTDELRRKIYIPDYINDSSLRTESPQCYRDLDDCLKLLNGIVEETLRFKVIAYLGHL